MRFFAARRTLTSMFTRLMIFLGLAPFAETLEVAEAIVRVIGTAAQPIVKDLSV